MSFVNLGDYLTEFILSCMGHTFIPYGSGEEFDNDATLFAVGSILSDQFIKKVKGPRVVWGSGSFGQDLPAHEFDFRAVRGPLTRDLFQLPADIPLGDPALLLPNWVKDVAYHGDVIYVPHCGSRDGITRTATTALGADRAVDITCQRYEAESRIRDIAGASFVLTGSLHAAIIAQAYDVPWAICIPIGQTLVMPFKHQDWFAYLGIQPALVKDLESGRKWWTDHGQFGKIQDTKPLLEAFPYEHISNQTIP